MADSQDIDAFAHAALTDLTLLQMRAHRLRRAAERGQVDVERLVADLAELERLTTSVAGRIRAFVRDQEDAAP